MAKNIIKSAFKLASYRLILFSLFGLYVPFLLIWCNLVMYFTFSDQLKSTSIILYSLFSLVLLFTHKRIDKAVQVFSGISLVIVLWFIFLPASNQRDWSLEVSRLPKITFNDNKVAIENFRNFRYTRNETKEKFEKCIFDLDKLIGTDMLISYWDNYRSIAHTLVCFRFEDGQNIAISLEVRKEKGEKYHPTSGMFKQYELIYIIGDEKDLIPLRTKLRKEETFLYPMNLNKKHSKLFLIDILEAANDLHANPRFYNSLGQNCTTTLIDHLNKVGNFNISFTSKVLLNGISDYYAYQLEGIINDLPFEILKRCCYISDIANKITLDNNFSINLRKVIAERINKEKESK